MVRASETRTVPPTDAPVATRLNWGCGDHTAPGWLNVDIKSGTGIDLSCDIRQGLPLESASIDYAVSIHALPELAYPEIVPALTELRRVLKPGGVLRLALPDLRKGIRAYVLGTDEYFKVDPDEAQSRGGRFIVHMLWYGHSRTLFTADFTEELLLKAGFEEVVECRYRKTASRFPGIIELDNRERESLYVEATRPMGDRETEALSQRTRIHGYNPPVARVEILDVSVANTDGQELRRAKVEQPTPGSLVESGALKIVGWVVGRESPAVAVEVVSGDNVVGSAPVDVERPGVAEAFDDAPGAKRAGFRMVMEASGKGESELLVRAVLEDGTRAPVATIRSKVSRRGVLQALRRR